MSNASTLLSLPVCVDLDGTLSKTDTLIESLFIYIKKNPINLLKCIGWLFLGKAKFKSRVSAYSELRTDLLPYRHELLTFINSQYPHAKRYLCTAANVSIAESVASHLGGFDGVIASSDSHNLKGKNKAGALVSQFGENGFVYAGNETSDLDVWRHAAGAIIVSNNQRLIEKAGRLTTIIKTFDAEKRGLKKYLYAIRLHQWVKNILMFLPMLLAHKFLDFQNYINISMGFVAFGLVASSTYLINDLMDLDADRMHERKRNRPFAAGELSIATGMFLSPLLMAMGLLLAYIISMEFFMFILLYLAITLVYSYMAKMVAIIDILMLAILYTIRLMAGAVVISEPITFWLLAYSMFIFFSLANVKRYTEIIKLDKKQSISGRGYSSEDASFIKILGISSGLMSVLIFALYINDPGILSKYSDPIWLWMITPLLLYWITRIWHLTYHGRMDYDPVVFALKDHVSYIVVVLIFLGIYLAI